MIDATPHCAEPRYDSWRPWSGAGRWSWLRPGPGPAVTPSALNAWSAATLTGALRALGTLVVDHTLFIDGNLHGDSNHELYLKNQPILAGMFAALSASFGPVAEFEGLPSVTGAGYDPDDGER